MLRIRLTQAAAVIAFAGSLLGAAGATTSNSASVVSARDIIWAAPAGSTSPEAHVGDIIWA
ncbi:hypothetical protein [Streptomyces sp. CBMA152]|uniref:hypothetical protein n=1 Tax=Streptomyces sp. CBMA152 TaxID=1896312 RepID=UPI001661363B|nr:hypothetical protein [Streptomyces sp. CBMA152]MBD0741839.1 hypothetical protein [Streptomyces sp. CBMA152]